MGQKSWLTTWLEYAALRGVATLLDCFDVDQNLRTAAAIGDQFFLRTGRHRQRAIDNLTASFPEWSPDRIEDVARRSFHHMFQMFMVDALVMPRLLLPETWPRHVTLCDIGQVLERLVRREPLILATGHCGNWELLGYTLAVAGFPIHAVARPLDNARINKWLLGIREARGMTIITKWGATPVLQRVLRQGGQVGFIADQSAGDQGLFVPFFGRMASSYKSIGLLAMRYNVPIVVGGSVRVGERFEYELHCDDFIRPEDWANQPDPLYYITARYNRALENAIRRAPHQYLWLHRRWRSRPRHERLGRPMPRLMRERLEALPWMTQTEMDRLQTPVKGAAAARVETAD